MRLRSWFSVFYLLVALFVVLPPPSVTMALTWQDIAGNLMSPACPGRTVLNCTSGQAVQWRELIRQKLVQGETKQQIMQYFIDMRGEEILAAPPKHGFGLTAWLFPLFVMLNGAGLIVVLTWKWTRQRPASRNADETSMDRDTIAEDNSLSDSYRQRLQQELKDFTA